VNLLNKSVTHNARRTKRIVGAIAVALLLVFTVLAIIGDLSFIEWIIADLLVALVANLIFRNVGKPTKQASK
jgi:hypothetical protein